MKEGIEKADQKIASTRRAITRMDGQRDRLTAKTELNLFAELLDNAIASAEASLTKLEATKATAQRAIDILTSEYEPGPGAVEPAMKPRQTLDDFKRHPLFLGRPAPPFFSRDLYDQY